MPAPAPSVPVRPAEGDPPLKRDIGTGLLFVFILGDVLGAGIYATVGTIAAESGGAVWAPLLLALGLALLTAASYTELVTKYPRAGGAAVFARRAYRSPLGAYAGGLLAAGLVLYGLSRLAGADGTAADEVAAQQP